MLKRAVIDVDDPLRTIAERFIRASFASRSGVRLDAFPPRPLVIVDARDESRRTAELPFLADASEAEAFAIASPVFANDPKDTQGTGLVDAEAV